MSLDVFLLTASSLGRDRLIELARSNLSSAAIVSVSEVDEVPFARDMYGFVPTLRLGFRLDKFNTLEARATVASAVRTVLAASEDDTLVRYIDRPIVRRIRGEKLVRETHRDFVPTDGTWVACSDIPEEYVSTDT